MRRNPDANFRFSYQRPGHIVTSRLILDVRGGLGRTGRLTGAKAAQLKVLVSSYG